MKNGPNVGAESLTKRGWRRKTEWLGKGRYMLPVFTSSVHGYTQASFNHREHGLWRRPVNTGSECVPITTMLLLLFAHGWSVHTTRVHGPSTRPVNTGVVLDTRDHGPSRRAVFTGSADRGQAVIDNDVILFSTCRMSGITRVTNTAREHGYPKCHPCSQVVFSTRPVHMSNVCRA